VRDDLWDAASSFVNRPGDRFLAIGNPTDPSSRFKRECDSGRWNVVVLSCLNHPNVVHGDSEIIPGAVTKDWCERKLEEYGADDAPLYMARVLGLWPRQGVNSLISVADVTWAQEWDENKKKTPAAQGVQVITRSGVALGLDVAGYGSDLCVCWKIEDNRASILWHSVHTDIMETCGRVARTIDDLEGRAKILCIDDTGIGHGVSMRLLEVQRLARDDLRKAMNQHLPQCGIRQVNFAQSADMEDEFHGIKSQMWWWFRTSLEKRLLGLPSVKELEAHRFPRGNSMEAQLTTPIYRLDSKGRIEVFDKHDGRREETKALPMKSPDIAHGLILANYGWRSLRPEQFKPIAKTWHERRQMAHADEIAKIRREAFKPKAEEPDWYVDLNGVW
jgi:hypothetical protein